MKFDEFCEQKGIVLLRDNFHKYCLKHKVDIEAEQDYDEWFKLRGQWLDWIFKDTKV